MNNITQDSAADKAGLLTVDFETIGERGAQHAPKKYIGQYSYLCAVPLR